MPELDLLTPPTRAGQRVSPPGMKRYLAIWAGTLAAILAGNIALCALVDPYGVLGTPTISGWTAEKPAAVAWPRLSKPYLVARAQPATLVMGSSSADVGFDPDSNAWEAAAHPVFNLGIDGALPALQLRFLQHALAVSHPSLVILTVNFIDSAIEPERARSQSPPFDFDPRLRVRGDGSANPDYASGRRADIVFSTLSFTATLDSVSTLMGQRAADRSTLTAHGWNTGTTFRRWTAQDGAYGLFMAKDREKIPEFRRLAQAAVVQTAETIEMVRLAREHGARVIVAIMPNHADEMQTLRQLGLDAACDAWKTAIVDGVASMPGTAIWDFSGYTPYTTEAVPPPADRTRTPRWFWEPVHFRKELGDLMIARMQGAAQPADLGVRLTPALLPAWLAAAHAAARAWEFAHPADLARIAPLVRDDELHRGLSTAERNRR